MQMVQKKNLYQLFRLHILPTYSIKKTLLHPKKMTEITQELLAIKSILVSQMMYTKHFFSVPEAARYMDLSEDAIYKLVGARKLSHSKPNGKRIYIERTACDAYMRLNTVRTAAEIQEEASLRVKKKGAGKW